MACGFGGEDAEGSCGGLGSVATPGTPLARGPQSEGEQRGLFRAVENIERLLKEWYVFF